MTPTELKAWTFEVAVRVVKFVEVLPHEPRSWVLGKQLLRSGTSVGAQYRAACRAQSARDFISKMKKMEEERKRKERQKREQRELHEAFGEAYARWRAEWQRGGRTGSPIGLGVGMSYGRATIGYIGPAGKKQFGIYKMDGGKWIVCMTAPGAVEANRPKSFDTTGTAYVVFVFEKVEDEKKS